MQLKGEKKGPERGQSEVKSERGEGAREGMERTIITMCKPVRY